MDYYFEALLLYSSTALQLATLLLYYFAACYSEYLFLTTFLNPPASSTSLLCSHRNSGGTDSHCGYAAVAGNLAAVVPTHAALVHVEGEFILVHAFIPLHQ